MTPDYNYYYYHGSACCVMVTIIVSGHGEPRSNCGHGCLNFT